MIRLFKNLIDKEFKKILWGKVKFNFDDILEKIYSGNQGNLESNIISGLLRKPKFILGIWCYVIAYNEF